MALAFRFPQTSVLSPRDRGRRTGEVSLTLVPVTDNSRVRRVVVVVTCFFTLLIGVVALRTYIATQQMQLDKLNQDVSRARDHFDELRAERARLQSPDVLMMAARGLGMVPAATTQIMGVPADVAAEVAAQVGKVDSDVAHDAVDALDSYGRLKSQIGAAP